mmetsp:Transcript_19340/g.32528  ORF Transcript_19340/g.32528 Transcript_19340/m.32528 type:complete len:676 (+) Transcript_19340:638-2665(+)|eukprot:CAMPEP_0114413158 /NCGR_PEP_ID=MMETSP0103-20121206/708_1 /TAXON_ID=37642 ORGANISM="Paraphysomonas imperforata, Strain PA2" /NCGR_SAMPLE_ID=MMETSP0103 /ASSEMBLY_ACC=CAM_ASM_000201 /LENGTH=675 /DNA_ID=CAMNT_0001581219 /DNA_START=597 /DNA_END=2624 /DNA_ORIENTATION=+
MSAFTKTNKFTSLKLSFNGEIRRLPVHSQGMTYQGLLEKTLSVFPHLGPIQFSWVDDEKDTVVISSDAELAEALRIMACEKKGYLRFTVLSTAHPSSASSNQPSTSHSIREYGTITHAGVCCNECGASPVSGARFKCSGRENYDLCEPCEGFVSREPYPTLKIYHPDQYSAGLSVFLEEKGGPRRGTQFHRGITCNGCKTCNFKGPRFKCTKRHEFNLCQDCEVLDDHKHMMVKMYPQHSHMTVHIVADVLEESSLSGTTLPAATCHFRHSLYKRHGTNNAKAQHGNTSTRGAGWRKGKCKGKDSSNGKGRHCWDKSSIAAAAAKRARAKQEENDFLEDQLVEMCINATKQEQNSSPSETQMTPLKCSVGAHCWDRSSIAKAAAERARKLSLADYQRVYSTKPVAEESPPRQFPFLRKGSGRHNWDRFSSQELKNKAASRKMRRQRKSVIQEMGRVHDEKEDAHLEKSLLTMYHDSHVKNHNIDEKMSSGQSSGVIESKQGLKWVIEANNSHTGSVSKQAVKWVIAEDAPPQPPQRQSLALPLPTPHTIAKVSTGVNAAPPSAPSVPVDNIRAALTAKQDHLQRVIADQEKQVHKQQEEQKKQEKQQQVQGFNDEVSAWGHELEVLCDMGFSDLQQLVPLLKTHIPAPASTQQPGAPLCEEGLQQVVMSLLTGRN